MKRETLFLKIVVFLIGLPILGLCIFWLPKMPSSTIEVNRLMQFLFMIFLYIAAIPFFYALYQTYKILCYIDQNKAFTDLSVKALKVIKYCANTISILFAVILPFMFYVAQVDDAPGLAAIGLVITGASIVIAVFAAVLQKLLKHAIDIKAENDATI